MKYFGLFASLRGLPSTAALSGFTIASREGTPDGQGRSETGQKGRREQREWGNDAGDGRKREGANVVDRAQKGGAKTFSDTEIESESESK